MKHCRAGRRIEQQVFRPPFYTAYFLARKLVVDFDGHRPSQAAIPNNDVVNALLLDPRRDAAAAGFNFG